MLRMMLNKRLTHTRVYRSTLNTCSLPRESHLGITELCKALTVEPCTGDETSANGVCDYYVKYELIDFLTLPAVDHTSEVKNRDLSREINNESNRA